jgi:hypothetical protein
MSGAHGLEGPYMTARLIELTDAERSEFSFRPLVSKHRLHELVLPSDDELIALLDNYPRERLQAFTMGTDPCRRDDWHYVDASAASGEEIFAAVLRGRLWLNLLRVDLADDRYGEAIQQLTSELQEQCDNLGLRSIDFGTLLISSPGAMVYYHFDVTHQALWHLRGSKRIWLYPACDERFASREIMEEIFAGTYEFDEELPYAPEFDQDAVVYQLEPGDVVSWPQNAPHRIENLDSLNVSLSTGFDTDAADRRQIIYSANHLFRRRLGLPTVSTRETGPAASMKCFGYRVFRRAGWLPKSKAATPDYPKNLRIDPTAPLGYSPVTR